MSNHVHVGTSGCKFCLITEIFPEEPQRFIDLLLFIYIS